MKELRHQLKAFPLELITWIAGILAVLSINPDTDTLSLCPLDRLGLTWCPGCGLGRAMNLIARGKFLASWEMHPMAALAYGVILQRIWVLFKQLKNKGYYG